MGVRKGSVATGIPRLWLPGEPAGCDLARLTLRCTSYFDWSCSATVLAGDYTCGFQLILDDVFFCAEVGPAPFHDAGEDR